MGTVVRLKPAAEGVPLRTDRLSERTPLVSVFACDPELLPLVRHLLDAHGIFNVADWDAASEGVFQGFEISDALKTRFKTKLGRPQPKPGVHPASVAQLPSYRPI